VVCPLFLRTILSPHPSVALLPEGDNERKWIEESTGIISKRSAVPDAIFRIELNEKMLECLSDRLDGVALLAEMLSHTHSTGKYHELIRFFECAFQLSPTKMDKKLSQFLRKSGLGYDRDEVKTWLEIRNAATHADRKNDKNFVVELDVTKFIPRMEQAAYDVLLNKVKWRDRSQDKEGYLETTYGHNRKPKEHSNKKRRSYEICFQVI